uniref:Uncharacterized protein n=1 Tax=Cannabis sativa TaxID=3483 RepID=A0A803QDH8_CANSA
VSIGVQVGMDSGPCQGLDQGGGPKSEQTSRSFAQATGSISRSQSRVSLFPFLVLESRLVLEFKLEGLGLSSNPSLDLGFHLCAVLMGLVGLGHSGGPNL